MLASLLPKSSCFVDSDCNGNGKCITDPKGFTNCECTPGYAGPHCSYRDPCMEEGNFLCKNGSTCRRKNNKEYECKCRTPYAGIHCDEYNLCDVDRDECMDDLKTYSGQPFCHPCIREATCVKDGTDEYTCQCDMQRNPSGCVADVYREEPSLETNGRWAPYINQTSPRGLSRDNGKAHIVHDNRLGEPRQSVIPSGNLPKENLWNPIIPTIAIVSCSLYILFVIVLLILYCKRSRHSRLIVCCDPHNYDHSSYYLISVETGLGICAGARSGVYCFLFGEHGKAGPYPLFDRNLAKVHTLQRSQEDNFLVSHTKDLGRVTKIVIWCDKPKSSVSSWYCDKITVRNIKTNMNWLFYVFKWLRSSQGIWPGPGIHELVAASSEQVRKRSAVTLSCRHFCYQLVRHHAFIAPFVVPSVEHLTLTFVEWMGYMFFLIALYGFIGKRDSDMKYDSNYSARLIVLENGTIASFVCFLLGFTFLILFAMMILWSNRSLPTLLIWHKNVHEARLSQVEFKLVPPRPSLPPRITRFTNTEDLDKAKPSESAIKVFRIPSTDVVKTEEWIENSGEDNRIVNEDLAQLYQYSRHHVHDSEVMLDYGFLGAVAAGRQIEPNRFVYTSNSNDDSRAFGTKLEKDVRKIYERKQLPLPSVPSAVQEPEIILATKYEEDVSSVETDISAVFEEMEEKLHGDLAAGDFRRSLPDKETSLHVEFCEMDVDRCWKRWGIIALSFYWLLCLCVIAAATVVCCVYGGRYGFQRTYDWIISLTICLLQDFFIYQILKVLLVVLTITQVAKLKAWPTYEAAKISERFQVYYLKGYGPLPDKDPLKYSQYLPKNWVPTHHVVLPPPKDGLRSSIKQRS